MAVKSIGTIPNVENMNQQSPIEGTSAIKRIIYFLSGTHVKNSSPVGEYEHTFCPLSYRQNFDNTKLWPDSPVMTNISQTFPVFESTRTDPCGVFVSTNRTSCGSENPIDGTKISTANSFSMPKSTPYIRKIQVLNLMGLYSYAN